MKLFLKIFLSLIVILVLIIAGGMFYITRDLDIADMTIAEVKLSELDDGTYTGGFKAGRFSNELSVEVKDHRITDIKVVRDVTFALPEVTAGVFRNVMEKQSTQIDTLSGASATTKAYLKSIENALSK